MGLGLGAKFAARAAGWQNDQTTSAPSTSYIPALVTQDPRSALFSGFTARGPDTLTLNLDGSDYLLHQQSGALVMKASEKAMTISDRRAFTDAAGREVFTMKSRQFNDDYLGYIGERRVFEVKEVSKTEFAAEHRMSYVSATGETTELVLAYTEQGDGRITDSRTGGMISAFSSDPDGEVQWRIHVAAGVDVASIFAMLVYLDVVYEDTQGTSGGKASKAFGEGLGEVIGQALAS